MTYLNFNKEEVRELVLGNRHNNITTTYYLLLKKHIKMGEKSIADLCSEQYIQYINDPKNLKIKNKTKKLEETLNNNLGN
jgi:5'-AMP-activated protein kinase catalytic alpha subunit